VAIKPAVDEQKLNNSKHVKGLQQAIHKLMQWITHRVNLFSKSLKHAPNRQTGWRHLP